LTLRNTWCVVFVHCLPSITAINFVLHDEIWTHRSGGRTEQITGQEAWWLSGVTVTDVGGRILNRDTPSPNIEWISKCGLDFQAFCVSAFPGAIYHKFMPQMVIELGSLYIAHHFWIFSTSGEG